MSTELSFARLTDDHGIASELVHVSPIFLRCGPSRRGQYADRRETRAARTQSRHASRAAVSAMNRTAGDDRGAPDASDPGYDHCGSRGCRC